MKTSIIGRVRKLAYVAYVRTPTFISVLMTLDMRTLTRTLIFSYDFLKFSKFSGSYNVLFKNLLL